MKSSDTLLQNKENMQVRDKYGVFWYNQREILEWTEEYFAAKAAEFAASGVNIVMTFSSTHFRWSFFPWWDKINAALAKLVKGCHQHGIRVVEHHSAHLTMNPLDAKDWQNVKDAFRVRKSKLDDSFFPNLKDYIASGDPEILPGVRLSSCRQIDGRTGEYARTIYTGWGHCFNNPDFCKAYFKYLESVYQTGVDGIMTDDVSYFGAGNACACKHCREKFQKKTGYKLPSPAQWGKFYGDYDNPVFIAWLKFKIDSTAEFQRNVTRHAESLGYKMLRPNYATSTFQRNYVAYPFEAAAELWTCVFQENIFSDIKQTAWPSWTCIAVQRRDMGMMYNVPSMSMFYPLRYDDYYFSWALTKAWGQLLMATPEGTDLNEVEQQFAEFEKRYPSQGNEGEMISEVAYLEPRSALDFTSDAVEDSFRPLSVWMQAGVFQNLKQAVLMENQTLTDWQKHPLVVVAGANMLSDEQLQLMKNYVASGGKLVLCGAFGGTKADGTKREHPERILGLDAELSGFGAVDAGKFCWDGQQIDLPAVAIGRYLTSVTKGKVIARSENGKILAISSENQQVIWIAGGVNMRGESASHYGRMLSLWSEDADGKRIEAPPFARDYLFEVPGEILKLLMQKPPRLQVNNTDIFASAFAGCNGWIIHLVNVAETLVKPPATVSHSDILQNFIKNVKPSNKELQIQFELPQDFQGKLEVKAVSPEFAKEKKLVHEQIGRSVKIVIPQNTFSGYLRIMVSK